MEHQQELESDPLRVKVQDERGQPPIEGNVANVPYQQLRGRLNAERLTVDELKHHMVQPSRTRTHRFRHPRHWRVWSFKGWVVRTM